MKTIKKGNVQSDKAVTPEKILHRLARIEGQFKGIRRMIESKEDCVKVITQVSAIREAISMLSIELMKKDFACRRAEGKKIDEAYLKTIFRIK